MFVTKALVAGAFAAVAYAQSSVLTFTNVPNPITDGQPQAILYSTNDTTTPVTITLRKGSSTNLQTISTLTKSALGGQFIWTPAADLPDGNDYALQIRQNDETNYYGPFTVQGASASSSSSSSSSGKSSSATGSVTIQPFPYPISTSTGGNGSTLIATANGTTYVAPLGTGTAGTGSSTMRNTTMSKASLTSGAKTSNKATAATTTAGSTGSGTTGAGFQGSTSSTGATASSTGGAADFKAEGALALVIGAAAFFL